MSLSWKVAFKGNLFKQVGHPLGTFFLSGRIPLISVYCGFGIPATAAFIAIWSGQPGGGGKRV